MQIITWANKKGQTLVLEQIEAQLLIKLIQLAIRLGTAEDEDINTIVEVD